MTQKDNDAGFFVVWLLNCLAQSWNRPTYEVYALLQRKHLVSNYILPCYEVLHTMGREALVDDITLAARKEGLIA